ncbi:MAG: glycosyltransferase family 4 protein [Planctomycetaceae bacterium]|nr:glycosyltransferase family 4 protein [Planctomycetaceae bacterium]
MPVVRVLHVISGLFYGGGQRVVLDLLNTIPEVSQVSVGLCTLGEPENPELKAEKTHSIHYQGSYNDPRVLLQTARELSRHLKSEDWEILHTHGLDADLIGAIAAVRSSVQHICHLHITPPVGKRESWKARVRRILLRKLTMRNHACYIAVSDAVRESMSAYYGLPLDRVVTVRNGINLERYLTDSTTRPRMSRKLVISAAGRLVPMKGYEHLIDAAAILSSQQVEYEIRIAGTGSLLTSLEEKAKHLGVSDRVTFYGHVSEMGSFYEQADVFVFPSVSTEGLPLSVLEAMAAGLPVVATDVGGTREALRNGVDGFLISPGNAEELATSIVRLYESDDLRLQMGTSGRDRIQNEFSRERMAEDVVSVYQRMTAGESVAAVG